MKSLTDSTSNSLVTGAGDMLALAVLAGLLLWMWASLLADWLACWKLRKVTWDMLGRLAIACAVSGIVVAAAIN
jgi:hypothetical protein